jgi:hypothetical protein
VAKNRATHRTSQCVQQRHTATVARVRDFHLYRSPAEWQFLVQHAYTHSPSYVPGLQSYSVLI